MSGNGWVAIGAVLASLGVAAGAIGTHVLKESLKVEPNVLETYETAVRYQIYHALALVAVGLIARSGHSNWALIAAGAAFALGIVLFSGGIYAWLATGIRPFIMVVPIGGTAWIVGWLLLAIAVLLPQPAAR
jgi:uncharacterized membrane protein YgdD (TMEM256/DUF423 family)